MPATPSDVRGITGLPVTITDGQIQPFLDAAQSMINKVTPCLTGQGITDTDQIQAWLASHLISLSPVGKAAASLTEEQFENYSYKKSQSTKTNAPGVSSTPYGQVANELSCGCLMKLGKEQPSINFFG